MVRFSLLQSYYQQSWWKQICAPSGRLSPDSHLTSAAISSQVFRFSARIFMLVAILCSQSRLGLKANDQQWIKFTSNYKSDCTQCAAALKENELSQKTWFLFFFPKHINLRQTTLKFQFHLVVIEFFTELSAEKHTSHCLRNQGKI